MHGNTNAFNKHHKTATKVLGPDAVNTNTSREKENLDEKVYWRTAISVAADFSLLFFGTQEKHLKIRKDVVEYMTDCMWKYEKYINGI